MSEMIASMADNLSTQTARMEANTDFRAGDDMGGVGDVGGGGGPGKYISMIKEVGAWAASVSAQAGVASSWSGAMQSAASKVGS